jgi:DNA-binding transcriptional LysR family regulator
MLKIQLDELEIFNVVVQSDNFSDAANTLNVTSSVVSRTIKKLEHKLDTSLFNRTTRKIHLTQEGERLHQYALSITVQAQAIETYFNNKDKAPEGELIIDAATPFVLHAISPLIPAFQIQYPGINVNLQSTESNIDLIHNKVDVAIRLGKLEDSTLKAKKLGEATRKLYASPHYIEQYGIPTTASDLSEHICLAFSAPERLNTWPICDSQGQLIAINSCLKADNGETIKQLAIEGAGIACLSSFTTQEDVRLGRLVPILKDRLRKQTVPIYAVFYAENEVNNRVRCFLDFVAEHINFD